MSMNLAVGKLMDPNPRVIWKAFDGDPVVVLARVYITAVTLIQVAGERATSFNVSLFSGYGLGVGIFMTISIQYRNNSEAIG
jgi:hypothetical protein